MKKQKFYIIEDNTNQHKFLLYFYVFVIPRTFSPYHGINISVSRGRAKKIREHLYFWHIQT